jgi:hypothetical protein
MNLKTGKVGGSSPKMKMEITDEQDREIRKLQTKHFKEVNLGNYTVKRMLTYQEAYDMLNKEKLTRWME